MSNCKYYSISLLIFLPNILLALHLFYSKSSDRIVSSSLANLAIKRFKSPVLPFITYFLPGLFYYMACVQLQYEGRKKWLGVGLAMYGGVLIVITTAFAFYSYL